MAGNHRSGRRRNLTAIDGGRRGNTTTAKRGIPDRPASLDRDDIAQRWWTHYTELLDSAGVLTVEHGSIVGSLSHISADLERARADHADQGFPSMVSNETKHGVTTHTHPIIRVIDMLQSRLTQTLAECGLTPTSAHKTPRQPAAPVSKWSGL